MRMALILRVRSTRCVSIFFNGDGTPYLLVNKDATNEQSVNYLDQAVIETDGKDNDHTAEIKTKAVLVLNGETKAIPASVIAVINPDVLDNTTLQSGTMTLSEHQQQVRSFMMIPMVLSCLILCMRVRDRTFALHL